MTGPMAAGLHPGILDAAFQAAGLGVETGSPSGGGLPFSIDSLEWFAPCPEECFSVTRRRNPDTASSRTDIYL